MYERLTTPKDIDPTCSLPRGQGTDFDFKESAYSTDQGLVRTGARSSREISGLLAIL